MDSFLNYENFDTLRPVFSDKSLRQNIRLLCVFGCGAAEVIYATHEDKVYCYGRNRFGGLGLGVEGVDIKVPQLNSTLSDIQLVNIFIGFEHWLALSASGQCYAWGHNEFGQLGVGTVESITTPQLVETLAEEMVVQISCGGFHTLALTVGGQVYSWGENKFGQLGDNTMKTRLTPVFVSIAEEVVSISCGKKHSLALTAEGQVYVWGINGYGQCGRTPTKYECIIGPQTIPNLKTIVVSKAICGPNHTLLLTTEGYIYSFGENTVGQVGDGTVDHQCTPIRIREDLKFQNIIANKENDLSIAVSKFDKYYVWGLANNRRYMSPKEVTDTAGQTAFDIYAKNAKNKITYKSVETNNESEKCEKRADCVKQLEVTSDLNGNKELNETMDRLNETIDTLNEDIIYSNSCIRAQSVINSRKTMDSVLNLDYFLKNKTIIDENMRKRIKLLFVFGIYGSKVIFATNEDKVYAFGHNRDGCLGIGTTTEHILNLMPIETLCGKQLIDISSGYEHCIGLTASGQIYGWGVNKYGQLGIGNIENQTIPQLIQDLTDKKVVQIGCGSYHSMALTEEGELFSWGHNTFAQLGDRTYNSRETPTQVLISDAITSFSCGINHSLALTGTGYVYVWGVNESGQLGRERHLDLRKGRDKAMSNRPKLIPGLENTVFQKAICGPNHSMLLTDEGHIYVFGDNSSGQIGNGTTETQTTPFKLNKSIKIKDIITCFRDDISIAIASDNNIYVWGLAMNEKVLRPRPLPESFGKSLFEIYVKLAKNKVTFKAVNINEDIDRYLIKSDNSLNSKQINDKLNERKESLNSVIKPMNIDKNQYTYNQKNRFSESEAMSENEEVFTESGDHLTDKATKTGNGSQRKRLNSDHSSNYVSTNGSANSGNVFLKHLHKSFNNPNNCDLIITSGEEVIHCHKTILEIRNAKFWRLLSPRLSDENQIPINPDSYHSFHAFLQYLYGIEPEVDLQFIPDLIKMADFFQEPELKELCTGRYKLLESEMDVTNVCAFYEMAVNNNLKDMETVCLRLAANNWKTILRSDAFQQMDDSLSKRLILSIPK